MSYSRAQPAPSFPPNRAHVNRGYAGPGSPGYPPSAPGPPAGFTAFAEPPESPAWGYPRVPDPRSGQHVSSMSVAFYRHQQPMPQQPPPLGAQQPFAPFMPAPPRKKKTSFFGKKFDMNAILAEQSQRGRPPLGPRTNDYRQPTPPPSFTRKSAPPSQHQQPEFVQQTTFHQRFMYEPGPARPRSSASAGSDYFDDEDLSNARTQRWTDDLTHKSLFVDNLLDRKWRSWNLPQISLDNMEKVKSLGEGSSGTVSCIRIRNNPKSQAPPHLVGRLTAIKVFRQETFDSGAVEVAADKAFSKLLKTDTADEETAEWVSKHIVRLVGKTLGFTSIMPGLHSEYCEGGEVIPFLEKNRNKPELRVQFVTDLLKAAHVCHAAGIVHLDIKVENCFIAKGADRRPILKLGDFGGAMKYPIVGSPKACSFPPPEVTLCERQAPLSHAWDIWASAVAIACMLGANRDTAISYQHTSNVRCHRRQFPIHTIEHIADLREGLLDPRGWDRRPSPDMLRWLEAAFSYDEDIGAKQKRPDALELLNAFPHRPYV